jgi:hypothetical protein
MLLKKLYCSTWLFCTSFHIYKPKEWVTLASPSVGIINFSLSVNTDKLLSNKNISIISSPLLLSYLISQTTNAIIFLNTRNYSSCTYVFIIIGKCFTISPLRSFVHKFYSAKKISVLKVMADICNPSYSGGWGRSIMVQNQPQTKMWDPI